MSLVSLINILKNDDLILVYTAILLGVSSIFDLKFNKIPNMWLGFWIITGTFLKGPKFILILALSISILFIFFLFRLFGAGDLKLIAVMTAFLGIKNSAIICFISLTISAIYALYILLKRRILFSRLLYFKRFMDMSLSTMTINRYYDRDDEKSVCMPMAHWFLLGFLVWRIYILCKMI